MHQELMKFERDRQERSQHPIPVNGWRQINSVWTIKTNFGKDEN